MIQSAKIIATASIQSRLDNYKKRHPQNWKKRLTKRLEDSYNALVSDLKSSYSLGDPVEFDGL